MRADRPKRSSRLGCEISEPVVVAAFKETMMHHALDKEKKDDCQEDCEQELPNSK
jgi:hypothetical protein